MTITLKDVYEEVTTQAWSIFDNDISTLEEDDAGVIPTIKKALNELWNDYKYSFKLKSKSYKIRSGNNQIIKPVAFINKLFLQRENADDTEIKQTAETVETSEKGEIKEYFIKYGKIFFKPTPVADCNITIEYYNRYPVLSKDGTQQLNFKELTDYIDIPEEFEDLFLRALITRVIAIYPHPNNLINQTYREQSQHAYKLLVEASDVGSKVRCIVW